MALLSSIPDMLSAALVLLTGLGIASLISRLFDTRAGRAALLYLWHTLFCLVYASYVIASGGDALMYYNVSLAEDIQFSFGTAGVLYLTSFLTSVLGLGFLGAFLVFNIFGFVGLLAFDASLRTAVRDKSRALHRFVTLIVFLPSVSFWSSAIGKDSLSFMAAGLALWAALDLRRRVWLMVPAVLLMLLVRPHMAAALALALAFSIVFQRRFTFPRRILAGGMAIAMAVVLVPLSMDYSGLGSVAGAQDLIEYVEKRQEYNMVGGGGVDISAMPLPLQLFTYMFRPLPFEAHSVFALAASLDNMVLLFLFFAGGWAILKGRQQPGPESRVFLWSYSLLAWLTLAMTTANLGISVRQKWMFAPMLIFLFLSALGGTRGRARTVSSHSLQSNTQVVPDRQT